MSAAAHPSQSRGWWRRNAAWLAGATVLGMLAFAIPLHEALSEKARRSPQHALEVAPGTWARYHGARWRVIGAEVLPAGGSGSAIDVRDDDAMLVVRFETIPDAKTLGTQLDACQGRVSDDEGRYWEANPPGLSGYRSELQRQCGSRMGKDFNREQALGGRPFRFEHVYRIPKGRALTGLHPELRLSKAQPPGTYLRFALRGE